MNEVFTILLFYFVSILKCFTEERKSNSVSHLHDTGDLLHFTLSWEEGIASVQLCQNAAQAPHVYGHAVRVAQNHLWWAVEAALNVSVHCRWEYKRSIRGTWILTVWINLMHQIALNHCFSIDGSQVCFNGGKTVLNASDKMQL